MQQRGNTGTMDGKRQGKISVLVAQVVLVKGWRMLRLGYGTMQTGSSLLSAMYLTIRCLQRIVKVDNTVMSVMTVNSGRLLRPNQICPL